MSCQRTDLNPKYRTLDLKSTVLLGFFYLFVFAGLLDIIDSYGTFHATKHDYIGEINSVAQIMLDNYGFYGLVGLYHFLVILSIVILSVFKDRSFYIKLFMIIAILAKFCAILWNTSLLIFVLHSI